MTGTIQQINVSHGGVPKLPVLEGNLNVSGFEGDSWAHPKFHGSPEQAVLLIASEVIAGLVEKGYQIYPGALGENLTTIGLNPAQWRTGQIYRVGEAEIELTTIRVPCNTLNIYNSAIKREIYNSAVKNGDTSNFLWARSGFYAKVLKPGFVFPGNPIRLMSEWA